MEPVFDYCAYLARLTKATLRVVHVLDITAFSARPIETAWEEAYIVLKSEAVIILEVSRKARIERGLTGGPIRAVLLEGHLSEGIARYIKDHAINLIVLGVRRRKGFDRLFMGNDADKIIRTAVVPVLIVLSSLGVKV
ncbi:MAG: universal stress protein [Euryarchaeota archaeon]|nr:universal stress protein [Euryarchaeota archaeon]